MFWRKKEKEIKYQLPPLDDLETWVPALISSFNLREGEFTFLPAYGGVLLFIKDQGISWLPYEEIKEIIGKIDKTKLAENTALAGSIVAVSASGGALLPIILIRGVIKGTYRNLVNPPPVVSLSILKSLIEKVVIEREKKVSKKLMDRFEKTPFKKTASGDFNYRLIIHRKFFSEYYSKKSSFELLKKVKNFFFRSLDFEFIIPYQADVLMFAEILESNDILVEMNITEETDIEVNESQ